MDNDLHIPWANDELEKLVFSIVNTGETSKVDFKSAFEVGSAGAKAELAKDIQAFTNSFDPAYRNHGFIILGASQGKLLYTAFSQDADKMQATIDQIVREHVGPFMPTQVRHFGEAERTWGVIVVPPSRNAPHVFIRDTEKFKRGDILVRSGTTTSKAEPADFARFYRVQLEDHTREIWDQVRDLQREVSILKKRQPRVAALAIPAGATTVDQVAAVAVSSTRSAVVDDDLLDAIERELSKTANPVTDALLKEAHSIRAMMESKDIPWDLNNITKESGRVIVDKINERAEKFWEALAHIVHDDDAGRYDDAIVDALSVLAFEPEAPSGTSYTTFGTGLRLYPLTMCLYLMFMIGLRKKRDKLLKRVMTLTLSRHSYYDEPTPIAYTLFYVRRADEVFQTARDNYPDQRWCDGVGSYIERWIGAHLFGVFPELERNRHYFYIAEFVLSIMGAATTNIGHPPPGLFFYIPDSRPVITRFLKTEGARLKSLFGEELRDALALFDQWGHKIANSGRCWGDGFQSGAVDLLFPPEVPAPAK